MGSAATYWIPRLLQAVLGLIVIIAYRLPLTCILQFIQIRVCVCVDAPFSFYQNSKENVIVYELPSQKSVALENVVGNCQVSWS